MTVDASIERVSAGRLRPPFAACVTLAPAGRFERQGTRRRLWRLACTKVDSGTVVIDCQTEHLDGAAEFWSKALGWATEQLADPSDPNYRKLITPPSEVSVLVQAVSHSSRVHVDIETDDLEAEVRRLEGLGAKRISQVKRWWVMEAPTGQRFCVVRPQRPDFEAAANVWNTESA